MRAVWLWQCGANRPLRPVPADGHRSAVRRPRRPPLSISRRSCSTELRSISMSRGHRRGSVTSRRSHRDHRGSAKSRSATQIQMCASCSQVMPIPPRTWMQSLVFAFERIPIAAAPPRRPIIVADSWSGPHPWRPGRRRPRYRNLLDRSNISAHMCLMAWKLPIGLPNCSRTLA